MTNIKKMVSSILSAVMLLTSANISFANEMSENNIAQDEVYCTYLNENSELVDVTMDELIEGNWDAELLDGAVPLVYEDFPARVENEFNNLAQLDINITYLKTLGNNDSAVLTVTDLQSGMSFLSESFNDENPTKTISNIPIGKNYALSITEEIDGVEAEYNAVITTQYEKAQMPSNVSVYGRSYTGDDTVEKLVVRERGGEIQTTEDGEEIPKERYAILASELPALYQSLSADKLYSVEASRVVDGEYQMYKGFINKANDVSIPEIFVPTHSFYDTVEQASEASVYLNTVSEYTLMNTPSLNAVNEMELMSTTSTEPVNNAQYSFNELKNMNPIEITELRDKNYYMDDDEGRYRLYRYDVEDTKHYRYRVISNHRTYLARWVYYGEDWGHTENTKLNCTYNEADTTTTMTFAVLADSTIFIKAGSVLERKVIFTVERIEDDDQTNSWYDLEQSDTKTASNTVFTKSIEYKGDTDSFIIDAGNAPTGKFGIKINNMYSGSALKVLITCKSADSDSHEDVLDDMPYIAPSSKGAVMFNYVPGNVYFVSIVMDDYEKYGGSYTIEFVTPDKHDAYETAGGNTNNDTAETATVLTGESGTLNGLTIHKGDGDYFKINSGATGADITVTISKAGLGYNAYANSEGNTQAACIKIYQPELTGMANYNEETFYEDGIEGVWNEDYNTINMTDVAPNTDVIFEVVSLGQNYSAAHDYSLEYTVSYNAVYTATLNQNVSLNKTEGEASTVNALKEEIAENTVFTMNSQNITSAEALEETDLYYISGTDEVLLTDTALNALTEGTYTLKLKYNNVEATGGTITLTVEAPASNVAEVVLPTFGAAVTTSSWDWARCAKAIGNIKRVRDGLSESTVTDRTIAIETYRLLYPELSTIQLAAKREKLDPFMVTYAAEYVYNGTPLSDTDLPEKFIDTDNLAYYNENTFYNMVTNGKIAILYLRSISQPANYDAGAYVVLCGVNKDEHTYKIYNPVLDTADWYPSANFYSGGAMGNSDLVFSGAVVEID